MIPCYVLDIGVYNVRRDGRVLSSTTAAWARVVSGTDSLGDIAYSGSPGSGVLSRNGLTWDCGRDIVLLSRRISADLAGGSSIALGFEAPMWFPVTIGGQPPRRLFGPRFNAEKGNEWYLQSGAAATMKAFSLDTLLLSSVSTNGSVRLTTDPTSATATSIVLFEAFVVGGFKHQIPSKVRQAPNEWDAFCAGLAWCGLHNGTKTPRGLASRCLHSAGDRSTTAASVWRMLGNSVLSFPIVEGPNDCEVVALASDSSKGAG